MSLKSIDPVAETAAHGDELQQKVWLTPADAARYLSLNAKGFFMFRQRAGLPVAYRYRRAVLDGLIERQNRLRERATLRARQSHRKAS